MVLTGWCHKNVKYSKNVDIEILKYKDRELRTETEKKPKVNIVTELQRTASLLGSVHVHVYIQPMSFTLLNLSAPYYCMFSM